MSRTKASRITSESTIHSGSSCPALMSFGSVTNDPPIPGCDRVHMRRINSSFAQSAREYARRHSASASAVLRICSPGVSVLLSSVRDMGPPASCQQLSKPCVRAPHFTSCSSEPWPAAGPLCHTAPDSHLAKFAREGDVAKPKAAALRKGRRLRTTRSSPSRRKQRRERPACISSHSRRSGAILVHVIKSGSA